MSPQEFTYWLQGALEMNPEMLEKGMTPEQTKMIQDHLDLVFTKVTPDRFEGKKKEVKMSDLTEIKELRQVLREEKSDTPDL